ncbi:AAA family ATPase [Pinibacter aurantiacus]|uniref:ATP-binding protein n=1 Tax=Pinibacter aurantiacus TaxID=2851599 RepID=A0A9E2S813_9BACT|nr:ATP-binding protein [Pinibacter aurantiacus]MBV4356653.1 ATP-binding protein [Pinibacter aurantiacus]
MKQIKKIVIIGPESTGKSTLCQLLAKHFNTIWVREYAREYLLQNGKQYTYEDLLTIAKGQINLENKGLDELSEEQNEPSRTPLLFIDTDMYVLKVWSEFVFGKCDQYILDEIVNREYDLYLLCDVDMPWVKDELREYPDLATREKLYHIYKDILINQNVPWVEVSGGYEERLEKAIQAVGQIIE